MTLLIIPNHVEAKKKEARQRKKEREGSEASSSSINAPSLPSRFHRLPRATRFFRRRKIAHFLEIREEWSNPRIDRVIAGPIVRRINCEIVKRWQAAPSICNWAVAT
jgi:hypothetical protein